MAAHGRGGRMAPGAYRGRAPAKPSRVLGRMPPTAAAAAANRASVESGQPFVIRFGSDNDDEEEEEEGATIPAAGASPTHRGTAVNPSKATMTASHPNAAASKSPLHAVNGPSSRVAPSPAPRSAVFSRLSPPLATSRPSPTPGPGLSGAAGNASAAAANGAAISSASTGLLEQIAKMRNQIAAMENAARAAATAQPDPTASGSATPPGNAAGVTPTSTSLTAAEKRVAKSLRRSEAGSDKAAAQQHAASGEVPEHDTTRAALLSHAALRNAGLPPSAAQGEKNFPSHSTACPPLHTDGAEPDAEPPGGADAMGDPATAMGKGRDECGMHMTREAQSLHTTPCDVLASFRHEGFGTLPANGPAPSARMAPDPPLSPHFTFGSALQPRGRLAGLDSILLSADVMRNPESIWKASDPQHVFTGPGESFQWHAGAGAARPGPHQAEPMEQGRRMASGSPGAPGIVFGPSAGASGVPFDPGFASMPPFPSSLEIGRVEMPGMVQADRALLLRQEAEVERALEERQRERRMWEDRERGARRALREAEEQRAAAEAECHALEKMRQSISLRIASLPRAQRQWSVAFPEVAPGARPSLNGPEPVLLLRGACNAVPAPGNASADALVDGSHLAVPDETRLLGRQVDQPAGCTGLSGIGSPGPMQESADVDVPLAPTYEGTSCQISAEGDREEVTHREGLSKKRKHPDAGPRVQTEAQATGLGPGLLVAVRQEENIPRANEPAGSGGKAARIPDGSAMDLNGGIDGADMDSRLQDPAEATDLACDEAGAMAPLSLLTPVKAPEQQETWQDQEGRMQHRGHEVLTVGGSPRARLETGSAWDVGARQKADSIRQRLVSQLAAKRQPRQTRRDLQTSAEVSTQAPPLILNPGPTTGGPSLDTEPAALVPLPVAHTLSLPLERAEPSGPAKMTVKQDDEHNNGLPHVGPTVASSGASGEHQTLLRQQGEEAQLAELRRDVTEACGPSHGILGDRATLQDQAESAVAQSLRPAGAVLQESQRNGDIDALRSRVFSSLRQKRPELFGAEQHPAPLQGSAARAHYARAKATQAEGGMPPAAPSPETAVKHEERSGGEWKASDSDGPAHGSAAKAEKRLPASIGGGQFHGFGDPLGSLVIPLYDSPFHGSSFALGPDLNGTKARSESDDSVGIAHRAYESPLKCLQLYQQLFGARMMDSGPAPPGGQARPLDGLDPGSARVQVNGFLCPFQLRGKCKDPQCPFQHPVLRQATGDVDQKNPKDEWGLLDGQRLSPAEFLARLQKRARLADPSSNFPPSSYSG